MSDDKDKKPADTPKPKPKIEKGFLARRIEMPIGLWNEILVICREGGLDHRDAVLQLLDLGLQAQDEGQFKPRIVPIDHKVWAKVEAVGVSKKASNEATLIYLVDLGLQAWAAKIAAQPSELPADGIRVVVDLLVGRRPTRTERIAEVFMPSPPVVGDDVSIRSDVYEVVQRAWTLTRTNQTAYLRVKRVED